MEWASVYLRHIPCTIGNKVTQEITLRFTGFQLNVKNWRLLHYLKLKEPVVQNIRREVSLLKICKITKVCIRFVIYGKSVIHTTEIHATSSKLDVMIICGLFCLMHIKGCIVRD